MAETLDDLYGAPLADFVGRRDELARALRKDGKREEAEAVKALRKPTVAAWAVNMLARRERDRVAALLEAGERLRAAHADLLAGGSSAAVQEASRAERETVEELVGAAAGFLDEAGRSAGPSTLDRVRDTLHAAAPDERVRELVREGRVVEDEEASGFAFAGLAPPTGARSRPKAREGKPSGDRDRERAEQRRRAAAERAAEARRELEDAERRAEEARRALASAEKEAKRLRSALERAERDVERR